MKQDFSNSCISPVDGRYASTTEPLRNYFPEKSLIRYRIIIEIAYFIELCDIPLPELSAFGPDQMKQLRKIVTDLSDADISRVKEIEASANHDVKAIEYFLKEKFEKIGLAAYTGFIHFGLTSQDINNTAIPLSFKEAMSEVMIPALSELMSTLLQLSKAWRKIPMLAHTHGQPASPTTVGKEILVFHERIRLQAEHLQTLPYPAKFGGATGNFNAHKAAYPEIDWVRFADQFTQKLGLSRSKVTTQIDHYDGLAALFDCLKRICTIIIDMDRDFWTYISMNYFNQKINPEETGSSTMPHKVNPIDFENSEGNAGIAIALFEHLSAKLPISRLQRDLTDSTVLRNIGIPLAHMLIAIKSAAKGLGKISIHHDAINKDLDENPAVVAEAIQTILRKLHVPEPYEMLKKLTRKEGKISHEDILNFIEDLDIPEKEKSKLRQINPHNYTGIIPD